MSKDDSDKSLKKELRSDFLPPKLKEGETPDELNIFKKKSVKQFTINSDKLKEYTKEELMKLLILADRKSSEQDNLIFEMRTLLQSGKGLGDILNLKLLLETFMSVVRERYNTHNSTILLIDDFDEKNLKFRLMAYHNIPHTYWNGTYEEEMALYSFPVIDGLLWQILKQGSAFSVQNYKGLPRFKVSWDNYNLHILESDIWCPLIKKGDVKGILTLGLRKDGTQVPESEKEFLQDLASIAVTNIDSVLKYEKNEIILRNIKTLYDINQQLSNVNDFKQLCLDTLSTAVDALSAQKGNLMLLNEETQELEIKVIWGSIPRDVKDRINKGELKTKTFKIGEGIAGKCAQTKEALRVNDRTKIIQVGDNIVHSILTVPLLRGNSIVGVINMTNKVKIEKEQIILDTLGRFTEDDEILLMGLADQAASNLHKARLYNASITDKLTGLFNTRHFDFELSEYLEIAATNKQTLALAVSDIDHFKKFNDTYGHKAGDVVLIEVARRLQETAKKYDCLPFRYGGEEFCLIIADHNTQQAMLIVEEFRKNVEKMIVEYDNKKLNVTVSIGISSYPNHGSSAKELFLRADEALYESKENGRNQSTPCASSNIKETETKKSS